jgi:hypothetical protein
MFDSLAIHGGEATIAWGWHTAAVFRRWRIEKKKGGAWTLEGSIVRVDPFTLKQRPLLFNIPRKGGYLCFPVLHVTVGVAEVRATLGPPEH